MSEPPASSQFTTGSRPTTRTYGTTATTPTPTPKTNGVKSRRADPPSDPPDRNSYRKNNVTTTSNKNIGSSSSNRQVVSSDQSTRSSSSKTSASTTPTTTTTGSENVVEKRAIHTRHEGPTFKEQVSGGSILKVPGRNVPPGPPVLSESAKKAMEEARKQQINERNTNTKTTKNGDTNKITDADATSFIVSVSPVGKSTATTKVSNVTVKNGLIDTDVSLLPAQSQSVKNNNNSVTARSANPNSEVAPTIPAQYQKKKATQPVQIEASAHKNPNTTTQNELLDTWEFESPSSPNGGCCIIS